MDPLPPPQSTGHVVTRNLKSITGSRIWSIICKGPKYRFPLPIDFIKCREEIAGALHEFCNLYCKREHVESNVLNSWKLNTNCRILISQKSKCVYPLKTLLVIY